MNATFASTNVPGTDGIGTVIDPAATESQRLHHGGLSGITRNPRLHIAPCFAVAAIRDGATLWRVSEVTRILGAAQQGDPTASEQLLPLVYDELRRLAAHKMATEAAGHTLQPTALVHEAWLRLVGN